MNKLGVSEYKLLDIERKIVNLKLNVLDEYFTFNSNTIDFKYLCDLHEFIFSGFYYDNDLGTRELNLIEKDTIEIYLKKINSLCLNDSNNIDEITNLIKGIWRLQPFIVGNTRTLIALLKILNNCFLLDLNVDVNKNIINNPAIFNAENFVNQKRLTKSK